MKVIILVSLLLFCTMSGASAWYDGFDYRIPITIDNVGNPALEDYQFNVSFITGINESSIRIVNDTDYTIVPHWCENETGGLCYELWFNVSVGSEVNTDYYIYYGNDSIPSTSDYDNTFTKKYNDSGLVLELHMDEGTGNSVTADSSGEGNDGALTNMNVTGNATSGWQGTDGGQWDNRSDMVFSDGDYLQFDGIDDYVNCWNDTSLDAGETVTVSAWVSSPSPDNQEIIGKGRYDSWTTAGKRGYGIQIRDSEMRVVAANGDLLYTRTLILTGNYHDGGWYNIVAIFDTNSYMTAYIDGVYKKAIDISGVVNINETGANTIIGKYTTDVRHFNGSIDEVRIYNRSLTEGEIYRQYIRSKYAANSPLISIGYTEEIPHPFLSGAYLFYGEMAFGLTSFKDMMGRYLIWGVVFFAISLAFALIAKIKHTLIGGK